MTRYTRHGDTWTRDVSEGDGDFGDPLWSAPPDADYTARRETPRQLHRADALVVIVLVGVAGAVTLWLLYWGATLGDRLIAPRMMPQTRFLLAAFGSGVVAAVTLAVIIRQMIHNGMFGQVRQTEEIRAVKQGTKPRGETIDLRWEADEAPQLKVQTLPLDREQLRILATGLVNKEPFTLETWTGRGKPLSRKQFEAVRGAFLERGLVAWRNEKDHSQGVEVVRGGMAALRDLAR